MRYQPERLVNDFEELAKFGSLETGGFTRVAFSLEDIAARSWLQDAMEAAGLEVFVDAVGNIRGRRAGLEDLPPVMLGSHLDTVPEGGNYDGSVGVLAALEIVRSLNDLNQQPRRPIEIINFSAEESSRFGVATIGSKTLTGKLQLADLQKLVDKDGFTLYETLEVNGYHPENMNLTSLSQGDVHAFVELHIEQGPILEAEGKDIGVVTHGQGLRWIECTLTGKESHTGSTPMHMRKNAGRGLALITELAHEIAMKNQPNAVGAIGHIDVYPNSRNIIPGKVVCTVDLRTHLLPKLEGMVEEFMSRAPELCAGIDVGFEAQIVGQFDPPAFDENCVNAIRQAAERLGYSHMDIVSGAGHDACWINDVAPTAMIMTPCVDGLSHNEAEEISPEWATAGADVLFHAVVETAEIVE